MGDRGINMNITSMVRGLTGDAKPGEARVLELKTGQQVRGVVQSVSADGKEAVVQINGVAVKAVLESPLQPGQATWLQVAGQQEDGTIVLKPSDGPNAQPMASIADALKQAGLPDEPWARQLIQEIQKSGVPITREMMEQLGQALKMKPSGVSLEQWAQTVTVAMKRQLPLTAAGLTGLQQAMFGKPLNELLSNFLKNTELLQGNIANNGNGAANAVLKEAQALVRTLLAIMPNASAAAEGQTSQLAGNNAATTSAGTAAGGQASGQTPQGQSTSATAAGAGMGNTAATSAGINRTATNVSLAKDGAAPQAAAAGAEAGRTAAQPAASMQAPAGAQAAAQAQTGAAAGGAAGASAAANGSAANGAAQQAGQAAQGGSQQAQPTHAGGMIGRMLTLLGVSHEHVVQRALFAPSGGAATAQAPAGAAPEQAAPQQAAAAPVAARTAGEAMPAAAASQAMPQAAAAAQQAAQQATAPQQAVAAQALPAGAAEAHESLKSTLLQLLKSDSLPPAIRESAQQIVQQITGQQLLLSSDRSQPFAHVTMFVPFVTEDGEQTAAVHIQSRQGRKGELDAENCRLWFDLDLKTLGRTMVDVNVVEKLVALNIHHEDEQVQEQLRPFRIEIESALESIGYQMSAYRVMPFPEKEETAQPAEKLMKDYTVENYRGVDLRI